MANAVAVATGLWVDRSITSASGSSQTILAANERRQKALIVNNAATDWTIHPTGGTASVGGDGCVKLAAGDSYLTYETNAITGIGTGSSKLTVLEIA